jgi:hypothetical protein
MEHYRTTQPNLTSLDQLLAWPMFGIALLFLILTGLLLPTLLYRDIEEEKNLPPLRQAIEPIVVNQIDDFFLISQRAGEHPEEIIYFAPKFRRSMLLILAGLYLLIVAEGLFHWIGGASQLRQHWMFALFPFMRLSSVDHIDGTHVWVPGMGWVKRTGLLEQHLNALFSLPMLLITLPILPLIAVQLIWSQKINTDPNLKFAMATATAVIWMAFVFEFSIMFNVARRRWKYCREHWINIAIIALPLIGFLRIAALGSVIKLKQVAKTASVLRLRVILIRFWRALIVLGLLDQLLRKKPQQKAEQLARKIEEKEEELALLRWQMAQLEEQIQPVENPESTPPADSETTGP